MVNVGCLLKQNLHFFLIWRLVYVPQSPEELHPFDVTGVVSQL